MSRRRIAQVPVSWDALVEALFPEGSRIEDAQFNFVRMTVDFVVSHPDLEEVPPGDYPPTLSPIVTTESVVVKRTIEW